MAIAGMILAISFPSFTAGLDGIRLQSTGRRIGAFFNVARGRADQEQLPVEIRIDLDRNQITALSADGRWERALEPAEGVKITGVWPPVEGAEGGARFRRFVLLPGVPPPRFRVQLGAARGRSATVAVDPLNGTPQIDEAPR